MIAQMSINVKLTKLREYLKYLKLCQKYTLSQIIKDPILQGAILHYLQLSIEAMLDVGDLIISEQKYKRPEYSRDIFSVLAEKKILPFKFSKKIAPLAGLRNILVHDYCDVDIKMIFGFLQNDLKDFDVYAKHIASFVKKKI